MRIAAASTSGSKRRSVTRDENFAESERIRRNLASASVDHTNAGCNEPRIIHFHRTLAAALDAPASGR